jgi:acetyl-CoA C-acetyltransferase
MQDVVVVGAARTPIGSLNGCLAAVPATQLGSIAAG